MAVYEVHVTKTYLVNAKTIDEARTKGMNAAIGQEADHEFGGMKVTTVLDKSKKAIKKTFKGEKLVSPWTDCHGCGVKYIGYHKCTKGQIERNKERQNANIERRDRDLGKEQEYIDFSAADRI